VARSSQVRDQIQNIAVTPVNRNITEMNINNQILYMIDFLKYGFHNLLSPVLYEGTIQSVQDKKSGLASKSMQRAKTHDMVVTLRRASLYR